MPNKRLPASLKLLKGDNKEHATRWRRQGRDEELAMSMASLPMDHLNTPPPDWMTPAQARTFTEMLWRAHKDVMSAADLPQVEMLACLVEYCRRIGYQNAHPNVLGKLQSCLDHLGMNPASRGKVAAAMRKKKEQDPLDEFADAAA